MAFRNSVKVTMLSLENEQQDSYSAQPAFVFEPPAPEPEAPPISNDAAPVVVAEPIASTLVQIQPDETSPAAIWHARADDLRAMTETLPSDITRELMPKIAALYDGLARDEGWREHDALPPEEPQPEAPACATMAADEAPPENDEPAVLVSPPPDAPRWLTHPRRPQPMGRRIARRRG